MLKEYPPLFEREHVHGVKVVRDEVLPSGLSSHVGKVVPLHGTRVLTLADGTTVHGCRDCEFTGTRGEVKVHRGEEHGVAGGGPRARAAEPAGRLPYPSPEVLSMTLYELIELAEHIDSWEDVLTNYQKRDEEKSALLLEARQGRSGAEKELSALRRKLARLVGDL